MADNKKKNPFTLYKPLVVNGNDERLKHARNMLHNYQTIRKGYKLMNKWLNPDGSRVLTKKGALNKQNFDTHTEINIRNQLNEIRKVVEEIDANEEKYLNDNNYTYKTPINIWNNYNYDMHEDVFPDFDEFSDPNAPNPWARRLGAIYHMSDDYINKRKPGGKAYKLEKYGNKFMHVTPPDPNQPQEETSPTNLHATSTVNKQTGEVTKLNEKENKPTNTAEPVETTKVAIIGDADGTLVKEVTPYNKHAKFINDINKLVDEEYTAYNKHKGDKPYVKKNFYEDLLYDFMDKGESKYDEDEFNKFIDVYNAVGYKLDKNEEAFKAVYDKFDNDDKAAFDALLKQSLEFKYPDNPANPSNVPIKKKGIKEPDMGNQPQINPQPKQQVRVNEGDVSSQQPVLIPQYAQPVNVHNLLSYDYALTSNAEYMRKRIQEANNKMFPRRTPKDVTKMMKLRIDNNKNVALKGGMPLSAWF